MGEKTLHCILERAERRAAACGLPSEETGLRSRTDFFAKLILKEIDYFHISVSAFSPDAADSSHTHRVHPKLLETRNHSVIVRRKVPYYIEVVRSKE